MKIKNSGTVSLYNLAEELKRKGISIFDFVAGEPDIKTPDHIIDYAFHNAKNGKTHYTSSTGIVELRDKIAEKYENKINKNNVIITIAKFGIYLSLFSIFKRSGEVIVLDPYYPSYPNMISMVNMKTRIIKTNSDFSINFDALENSINKRTGAIIINSPNNPTGRVYSKKDLRKIAEIAEENRIYVISDEIYENYVYNDEFHSMLEFIDLKRLFLVNSFSKSYSMAGWRIGFVISHENNIKKIDLLQQNTITCASSISQYAAIKALEDHSTQKLLREKFKKRMENVIKILNECDKLNVIKPQGSIYVFPGYNVKIGSEKIANRLLKEKNVFVVPGISFGSMGEYHFRISLGSEDEKLEEGSKRIVEFFCKL